VSFLDTARDSGVGTIGRPSLGSSIYRDTVTRDTIPPSSRFEDAHNIGYSYPNEMDIGALRSDNNHRSSSHITYGQGSTSETNYKQRPPTTETIVSSSITRPRSYGDDINEDYITVRKQRPEVDRHKVGKDTLPSTSPFQRPMSNYMKPATFDGTGS